jgi:hypothetical protein
MLHSRALGAAAVALTLSIGVAESAGAACTRLAFSVNDYGKVGPAKDAQNLLDKYIARWTADRGIKTYTVGRKDVSCELFIDLIVFDEYTCKAAATVCWNGPMPKGHETEAGAQPPTLNRAASRPRPPAAKSADDAGGSTSGAPISTGSVRPAPAAAPRAAPPVSPAAAPAAAPAATAPAATAPAARAAPAAAPAAPAAAPKAAPAAPSAPAAD